MAFTLPAIILYTVFFVFSVIYGIYYSFTNWNGYAKEYKFVGVNNYARLFSDRVFKRALVFTVEYSAILVVGVITIALILAVILCSKIKQQTFFRAAFFFPATLSLVTIGLVFNEIYYRVIPLIGKSLNIDFLSKNILSSSSTAMWGILIVHNLEECVDPHGAADRRDAEYLRRLIRSGRHRWGQWSAAFLPHHASASDAGLKRLYHPGDKRRTDGLRLYYSHDQRRTRGFYPVHCVLNL